MILCLTSDSEVSTRQHSQNSSKPVAHPTAMRNTSYKGILWVESSGSPHRHGAVISGCRSDMKFPTPPPLQCPGTAVGGVVGMPSGPAGVGSSEFGHGPVGVILLQRT